MQILDDVRQIVPTVSEKKTHATNRRGPNHRARKIKEEEPQVGHLEKPGKRSREHPQPGDEATGKNGPVTASQKEPLGVLKPVRHEPEALHVAIEEGVPPITTQGVTKAVAERRPGNRYPDRPYELNLALVSEEPRKQQDGFTRQGQATVFQHHAEEHHPVPVPGEEVR